MVVESSRYEFVIESWVVVESSRYEFVIESWVVLADQDGGQW